MHWSSATYNLCIWVTARYMKVENNKKQTPNWMRIYMIFRETESVVVVAHRPQPIRHRFVCVFLHFLVSRAHHAPNWIVLVPCIRAAVAATCICLRKSCCLCRSALLSLRKKKFKMKIKLCLLCDDRRDSLHTAAFCSPFKRKILLLFSSNQCAGSIRWDIVSDQLSRCDMTTNLGFLSSVDPFWSVAHSTIHRILRTYTFPFARASRDLLITQLIYWTGGRSLFSIAVSIPCDQQQQQQHIDPRNAVRNRVTVFLLLYFLCVYIAL